MTTDNPSVEALRASWLGAKQAASVGDPHGYAHHARAIDDWFATLSTTTPQAPVATLAELEREERAHLHTIDQRDEAEEAMSRAYALVTGRPPEWSNLFGYSEALAEMEEALSKPIEPADIRQGEVEPSSDAMREALAVARNRVLYEVVVAIETARDGTKFADEVPADHRSLLLSVMSADVARVETLYARDPHGLIIGACEIVKGAAHG